MVSASHVWCCLFKVLRLTQVLVATSVWVYKAEYLIILPTIMAKSALGSSAVSARGSVSGRLIYWHAARDCRLCQYCETWTKSLISPNLVFTFSHVALSRIGDAHCGEVRTQIEVMRHVENIRRRFLKPARLVGLEHTECPRK